MNAFLKILLVSVLAAALAIDASRAQTAINAASLPLCFEANQGQPGITSPFIAHGPDSAFLVTATNAQFVLHKSGGAAAAATMQFVRVNPAAHIAGQAEMPGKVNYFIGNDQSQWKPSVPVFAKVRVENIYPGINVVYYGNDRQLEYDFDLAAGVDPNSIAIRFDGAQKVSVNSKGELVISINGGEIIQHQPLAYQMSGQIRHIVSSGYRSLDSHTATFALGPFDHNLPLVIDPILGFSTYFGGNNGDTIRAIARGIDGSVYIAGNTLSTIFTNVQPGGYQTNYHVGGNNGDAFVAKFSSNGVNQYFTYLGGSGDDIAYGVAVDSAGDAFVTGYTYSSDFPHSTNVFQPNIAGQPNSKTGDYPIDAFVSELNTNGSALVYSTYLGGTNSDAGFAIAVDTNGFAYVVGYTASSNFPHTTNAFQSKLQCPSAVVSYANAFLAQISPGGTNLTYGSYFGGTNIDVATAIALDPANYIYVAGYTASTNFPSIHPLPSNNQYLNNSSNSYIANYDAFVAKFLPGFAAPGLTNPIYSTFLGGSNYDAAVGIAADSGGNAYVVGSTSSTNFPYQAPAGFSFSTNMTSCVQTNTANLAVATNIFLTKISWNGGANATIAYSAIFGGNQNDGAGGVALDNAGDVFVVGSTTSTNFPTTPNNLYGSLRTTNSSQLYLNDVFVTAFNTNAAMIYSGYLGGALDDYGGSIAVDPATGNAYIAGQTDSVDFPIFNGARTNLIGTYDGFLAEVLFTASQPVLQAAKSGTNLLVSWEYFGQETPTTFLLQSKTNLLSTNAWSVITNWPTTNGGAYIYTLPHTNSARFFRLQSN